jgi:hypothetical protein
MSENALLFHLDTYLSLTVPRIRPAYLDRAKANKIANRLTWYLQLNEAF